MTRKLIGAILGIAVLAVLVVLIHRRDPAWKLELLKKAPEIDASAIAEYMAFEKVVIAPDRLMVVVKGKAAKDLPPQTPIQVDRFKDGAKLDTVPTMLTLDGPPRLPDGYVIKENQPGPPPFIYDIQTGDPVGMSIDATIESGRITKLVIRPGERSTMRRRAPVPALAPVPVPLGEPTPQ